MCVRRKSRPLHVPVHAKLTRHQRGGESRGRPANASSTTMFKVDSHNSGHHDLVSAFIQGNASHYAKLLTEMMDLLHSDGNWVLAKTLEGRLLVWCTIRRVASVYLVVSTDVLEGKIQEVGAAVVGRRGIDDLLMGMARCDTVDPLLVDLFVVRGPQAWSLSSMTSTRTNLSMIMGTIRGGGWMPIYPPGSYTASPSPNAWAIWTSPSASCQSTSNTP